MICSHGVAMIITKDYDYVIVNFFDESLVLRRSKHEHMCARIINCSNELNTRYCVRFQERKDDWLSPDGVH